MGNASAKGYSRAYVLYAIAVVFLIAIFNVVDRTIVSLLVPGIQAELALSDTQIGLLLGPSFSVVHFFAVLPVAWLADRVSRRSVIAVGLLVWSAMTALGGMAGSFVQLFATRMGVGIGEAAGAPPSVSLLSDTAPAAWRARALSALTMGSLVGIGVGMLVGGFVSERWGWRAALVAVGLPGVLVALIVRFTLREPPRTTAPTSSPLVALRYLFGLRAFTLTVVATCLAGIGSFGRMLWEPTFLHRIYDLGPLEVGAWYIAIGALPAGVGAFVGSALADRLGSRDPRWALWICAIGNLAAVPFFVAFQLWPESHVVWIGSFAMPLAFVFSIIGALFGGFYSAPTGAVVQNLAPENMRAQAHAIWTMIFNLIGMGVGPVLAGSLSEAWRPAQGDDSIRYALVTVTLALLASSAAYVVAARHMPRSER